MKKLMLLTGLLAFLLFSCPEPEPDPIDEEGIEKAKFYAQDLTKNNSFYQIEAGKLADGTYCTVWVERGAGISKNDANKVAAKFDSNIYPKMLDTFGVTFTDEEGDFTNIEFADFLADGDGKLCILLLDIKDGYNGTTNKAYTAGYFWSGDLLNVTNSNKRDMIFIDTNPGLKIDPENTYATLAHEMQHMMSYVTGVALERGNFDTWVDEGLSSAAEWVYFNNHTSNGRVNSYKTNSSGLINKGNNFFVWGNRTDEHQNAVLDDYSTVYLFFQWLRIQSNSKIYADIITSKDYDYKAVTGSFSKTNSGYSDWSKLLETWLAANRINSSSGILGYKGEIDIKAPDAPAAASISLFPGEGVYSKTNADPSASQSGNIRYAYLSDTTSGNAYNSDTKALLTFNISTTFASNTDGSHSGTPETGTTTGVAASIIIVPEGRSIQPDGPIRLDAGDMLRRNGNGNFSVSPRPSTERRIITNEN